jgi:hypothetical protein
MQCLRTCIPLKKTGDDDRSEILSRDVLENACFNIK